MAPENLIIRKENAADHAAVEHLVEVAFKTMPFSDHSEHKLVARLRHSEAFIPELSLVATLNGELVGHILLTKITIKNPETGENHIALSLAPVSVLPAHQSKGIGGQLIQKAHAIATQLNYKAIVLLGHENYYPRFGYRPIHEYGISLPFPAPPENCMIVALKEGALEQIAGQVKYPPEFGL